MVVEGMTIYICDRCGFTYQTDEKAIPKGWGSLLESGAGIDVAPLMCPECTYNFKRLFMREQHELLEERLSGMNFPGREEMLNRIFT